MNEKINPSYWLRIAHEVAKASTCKAQVGCVLVHKKTIVGMGYVGSIHGDAHCDETCHIDIPVTHRGKNAVTCIRTIHAEMNAVLKCTVRGSEQNGWIECYSTHEPCLECLKILLQIGAREIYYSIPYVDERRGVFLSKYRGYLVSARIQD